MNKIKFADAMKFMREYETDPSCKCLRLGQAFLNKFFPREVDPDLFYKQNFFEARSMIFAKYVEM